MKIYMLFPKSREIVKEAKKDGHKISTYSKGFVLSCVKSSGVNEFKTYSYFGKLKKVVRHDTMKYSHATVDRYRIENVKSAVIKENNVTRFNDGLKLQFENWTMQFGKNVDKAKRYSAEYRAFEGAAKERKQISSLFRYF